MESVRERISSRQSCQPYPLVWEPNWGCRSPGQWSTEGAVGTALHGGPHSFCCRMILFTVLVLQRHAAATSDLPAVFASPAPIPKAIGVRARAHPSLRVASCWPLAYTEPQPTANGWSP